MVNSDTRRYSWEFSRTKRTFCVESLIKRLECTRAAVLAIVAAIIISGIFGCAERSNVDSEQAVDMSRKTIEQVQEEHTEEWMAIDGVEGIAIGLYKNKPCIKIFSSKKADNLRGKIPSTVEGYPVIIEETGTFRALDR
jgi:hypothetical protein